ncbi:hypothetical protein [Kribbella sp. HUAS MG21]|uniref:Uncharacterized protein n=1 Tax=Kribbella sp. HUAS MG21 TaxID=3160966 RepID=A0AAU7T7I7_9ACTN
MATDLRLGVRVALGIGGLALVGVGILLAFREPGGITAVAALVVGAVVAVAAVSGRMPSEVGLQRVTFGSDDRSPAAYRRAWCDARPTP